MRNRSADSVSNDVGSPAGAEGCFEISGRDGHCLAWSVGESDRRDAGEELLGYKLSRLADPASVGKVLLHCQGRAGTRLSRSNTGGHLKALGSTDLLAHVARKAVGGDDTESDAGDD